jgi:hypothetical protein
MARENNSPAQQPGDRIAQCFQQKLNSCFEKRSAERGHTITNVEVSSWLEEHGYHCKPAYLGALRNGRPGRQASPSLRVIEGLAAYFEIDPAVFFSTENSNSITP